MLAGMLFFLALLAGCTGGSQDRQALEQAAAADLAARLEDVASRIGETWEDMAGLEELKTAVAGAIDAASGEEAPEAAKEAAAILRALEAELALWSKMQDMAQEAARLKEAIRLQVEQMGPVDKTFADALEAAAAEADLAGPAGAAALAGRLEAMVVEDAQTQALRDLYVDFYRLYGSLMEHYQGLGEPKDWQEKLRAAAGRL